MSNALRHRSARGVSLSAGSAVVILIMTSGGPTVHAAGLSLVKLEPASARHAQRVAYRERGVWHRGHRRQHDGAYVDAPLTYVETGRRVIVEAPFTGVYIGRRGRRIVAPFVDVYIPR